MCDFGDIFPSVTGTDDISFWKNPVLRAIRAFITNPVRDKNSYSQWLINYPWYVAGAGQSIIVASADQHLLVEAGSPNVTFNADVEAGRELPIYNDLHFITVGPVTIARPSFQRDGPVLVVNAASRDHFEVLETTLPRVSVELNNPDMKSHTQVYTWSLSTGGTQDVTLIVSCKLFFL